MRKNTEIVKEKGEWKLKKSPFGYWSVDPMLSDADLKDLFQERYYQKEEGCYRHLYTNDEIQYMENAAVIAESVLQEYCPGKTTKGIRVLDVGCGQGYFARYFQSKAADVTTCDYTDYGIRGHNPELLPTFIQGDLVERIIQLSEREKFYELINMSQVFQFIRDPIKLLENFRTILSPRALLRISVPNDYSAFQQLLSDRGMVKNEWFFSPQHTLHYFTFISLGKLLAHAGYEVKCKMASFPIDVFILNKHSNYVENSDVGRQAHYAKVITDNFLLAQGIEKYINYYEAAAELGFGREIIMYASLNSNRIDAEN